MCPFALTWMWMCPESPLHEEGPPSGTTNVTRPSSRPWVVLIAVPVSCENGVHAAVRVGVPSPPPAAATTVTPVLALSSPEPAAPETVNVALSAEAPDAALRVSVEDWPALTLVGLKAPVTPAGRPLAESAIDCALPLV